MKKILIATKNPAKFSEIISYLNIAAKTLSLKDLDIKEGPVEDGKSFAENALKKARFYCKKSGLITIADDGGLAIDALKGEPGVHSHRWIDPSKDNPDEDLIKYTLKRMKNIKNRKAKFHVAIAVVTPNGKEFISEAEVKGIIHEKVSPRRIYGYPYRALFYFPDLKKYYDELTKEEHENINHRKKALLKINKLIKSLL